MPVSASTHPFDLLCDDHFPTTNGRDLAALFLGEEIGVGTYRTVWSTNLNAERVIKREGGDASFSNVLEWEVWQVVKDTKHARWFAPCYAISPCGIWMIQHRTAEIKDIAALPKKIPAFLTDIKVPNWGWIGDQLVCHDYGNNMLMENGLTSRMRTAHWRP